MAELIRIDGLKEVQAALLETPVHLRKKVLLRVLRKAAQPILKAAKFNAPIAAQNKKQPRHVIPGLLRKSLVITRSKIKKSSRGEFGVFITARKSGKIKRLQKMAKRVGAKGPNFGDPFYHKFQEGRPFSRRYLGNAFEDYEHQFLSIFRADVVREATAFFQKRAKR